MKSYITGRIGEAECVAFLRQHGFEILHTNYKNYIGEIDIIAKDGDVLAFVEVKTRSSYKFGLPREAVTPHKQHKIQLCASVFLQKFRGKYNAIRFDVLEVVADEITYIKSAF